MIRAEAECAKLWVDGDKPALGLLTGNLHQGQDRWIYCSHRKQKLVLMALWRPQHHFDCRQLVPGLQPADKGAHQTDQGAGEVARATGRHLSRVIALKGISALRPVKWKPAEPRSGKQYLPSTKLRRNHHGPGWQLLARDQLDGRTLPARLYDKLIREITADLGEDLTGIERTLADAYCITIVLLDDLSTRILLGQQIDMDALAQVIRCQVTLASRLGIARKPKDVSVTLDDYLSTGRKRSRRPPRQINGAIEYADAD